MYKDIINNYIEGTYPYKPLWLMRQAGRYLPEYMDIRRNVSSFLDLCYTPDIAKTVTLQPIERFDFDAAILFSDILTIPHALGQDLTFTANEGPKLNTDQLDEVIEKPFNPECFIKFLTPVLDTISMVRRDLPNEKTLIGFTGAPWTLASYMIEGGSSKTYQKTCLFAYQHPKKFNRLIELLTEAIIFYIKQQYKAGINIAKIFDSWAGFVPSPLVDSAIIKPYKTIMENFDGTNQKIIFFPRGCNLYLPKIIREANIRLLAIDQYQDIGLVQHYLNDSNIVIQGNLDPFLLKAGGDALENSIQKLLRSDGRHILNLGHGIDKETPIDNVNLLCDLRKKYYGIH